MRNALLSLFGAIRSKTECLKARACLARGEEPEINISSYASFTSHGSPNSMDMGRDSDIHPRHTLGPPLTGPTLQDKRLYILVVSPKSCNEAGVDDFEACCIGKEGGVFRKRDYIQSSN